MLLDGKYDDEDNNDESQPSSTRGWAIPLGISLFPIYLIFDFFGQKGRGLATIGMFVSIFLATSVRLQVEQIQLVANIS